MLHDFCHIKKSNVIVILEYISMYLDLLNRFQLLNVIFCPFIILKLVGYHAKIRDTKPDKRKING